MNKIRKTLKIILLIIACITLFTAVGCNNVGGSPNNDILSLNLKEISLCIDESAVIIARHNENVNAELKFTSSNEQVAVVDASGKITPKALGNTTITATFGNAEPVSCAVTVGLKGLLPQIKFNQSVEENLSVMLNGDYDLSAKVFFNGKTYDAESVEYQIANTDIGEMQDNKFVPKAVGKTQVTITASWKGVVTDELVKTINVQVKDVYQVYVNGGAESTFTLYTVGQFANKEFITEQDFEITAKNSLHQDLATSVSVKEGTDILEYKNGKIFAKKQGVAIIEVLVGEEGSEKAYTFPVTVIKPEAEYEEVLNFSVLDGNLPVDELFWEGATLTKAYSITDDVAIDIESNKLKDLVKEVLTAPKQIEIKVETATAVRKLTLMAYTKIIDEAKDLEVFTITAKGTESAPNFIEGYYLVSKDIDATSWSGNNHVLTKATNGSNYEGFKGIFDMAGHTITLNTSEYGLFGNMNIATIKDGKFIFTEKSGSTQSYGLAYVMGGNGQYAYRTNITNVDFEVNGFGLGSMNGDNSAVIGYHHTGWIYIKNCNFTLNAEINAKNKMTGIIIQQRSDWSIHATGTTMFIDGCTIETNLTAPIVVNPENLSGNTVTINYWAGNDGYETDIENGSFSLSNPYSAHERQCTGITRTITGELKSTDLSSTYMYSVDDGYFVEKGTGVVFTLEQLANKLEIKNYTIITDGVSYSNGVLSGIKVNAGATGSTKTTADADYWSDTSIAANLRLLKTTTLGLKSGESKHYLEFYAYDKVINEAEDFAVLDFNKTTNKYVKTYSADQAWLHGFFALSNDITYKESVAGLDHTDAIYMLNYKNGFKGVFDGNGYTAELNVGYRGVFGNVAGSVVKNTTFKLHFPAGSGFGLATQGSGEFWQAWSYYQNLNVEVVGTLPNTNDTAVLFRCAHATYTTLENVNVTVKTVDNTVKTTGLLVVWMQGMEGNKSYASRFSNVNVYTNSTLPIVTTTTSSTDISANVVSAWANNDEKTGDSANSILTGVNRYSILAK